jgi:hypothetical protein
LIDLGDYGSCKHSKEYLICEYSSEAVERRILTSVSQELVP